MLFWKMLLSDRCYASGKRFRPENCCINNDNNIEHRILLYGEWYFCGKN
jgi:hypothetical protein